MSNRTCTPIGAAFIDAAIGTRVTKLYPHTSARPVTCGVNSKAVPDECELACNTDGTPHFCDVRDYANSDCNTDFLPVECDLILPFIPSIDCDTNGTLDECDMAVGTAWD